MGPQAFSWPSGAHRRGGSKGHFPGPEALIGEVEEKDTLPAFRRTQERRSTRHSPGPQALTGEVAERDTLLALRPSQERRKSQGATYALPAFRSSQDM